eukprot:CAMPEP_0172410874 /NCGR_PEP_ID=MMETSP1061-20121228/77104_1 /TAXON_ID=37318 /ORGANISM="Pseudo-nitzschia pungens, Strain cf. pungens" /LENGTH=493 /DNA_ID=CAMNT_0013147077 /DNA_START=444 /DNA_END=1925 /DNA_ORIENTATION=+
MTDTTATTRAPILGFDEPEHEHEHEHEHGHESYQQQDEDVHADENDESSRHLNLTEMETEIEIELEIDEEVVDDDITSIPPPPKFGHPLCEMETEIEIELEIDEEVVDDDITSIPPPPKFGHPLWIYTLPGILAWPMMPMISTIVLKLAWIILPLTLLVVAIVALFVVMIEILERWMMGKLRFSYNNNNSNNSSEPGLMFGVQIGGNGGDRSRSKFAVVGRIERSLRKRDFESIRWEEHVVRVETETHESECENECENECEFESIRWEEHVVRVETETHESECENECENECECECECENENQTNNSASSPTTNSCCYSKIPTTKQVRKARCCAICLEDFQPGDDIVSSIDDCCSNNVLHRGCITTWWVRAASRSNVYGSNDNDNDNDNDNNESSSWFRCPCCRQPIKSQKPANEGEEREAYIVHMRSEYRAKMEAATRRQKQAVEAYMRREREAAGEDLSDDFEYRGLGEYAASASASASASAISGAAAIATN